MNAYFESHQFIFERRLDYLNLKNLGAWLLNYSPTLTKDSVASALKLTMKLTSIGKYTTLTFL